MKAMKKISALLIAVCLCLSCFSMTAFAADGRISFNDPGTTQGEEAVPVGETLEVKCTVNSTGGNLSGLEINLTYDAEALGFQSGDDVEKVSDGKLTYKATGSGSSSEASFGITFQALKEGETVVNVESATITSASGTTLDLEFGKSTVTIGPGDASKITTAATSATDVSVDVNGTTYTLSDSFEAAEIPAGFSETTVDYEGQQRRMVTQENSGVTLGYLVDGQSMGEFYVFNAEDATFSPFEQVVISDVMSIVILSGSEEQKLPEQYQSVTLTLNGHDFSAWQDTSDEGYYLVRAINSDGQEGYYRYDSLEETYQRFEVAQDTAESSSAGHSLGKIGDLITSNLLIVIVAAAVVFLILLITLIVVSVKLRHRDEELDDLYDEYGIDLEEDEEKEPAPVNRKKDKKTPKKEEVLDDEDDFEYEDDFDLDDEFDDDDFDDFDDDEYEEEPVSRSRDDYWNRRDTVAHDDEEDIEDLDALLNARVREPEKRPSKQKPRKIGHAEEDDTFKMDIIDLD